MFRKMWLPTALFLLSIFSFSLTPAGADAKTIQKNPQTPLSAPGDENWLPGFFSGLDNLEEISFISHVATTANGRVYLAGRFTLAGSHQQATVVYRQNGQWLPLLLPTPFEDTTRVTVRVMESYNSPNLYIQVYHPRNDTTLLIWNGSSWADLDIIRSVSEFLGIDNAGTPYIAEHAFGTLEAIIKRWDGSSWVYFATAQMPPTNQAEDGRPPTPPDPRVFAVTQDAQNNLYFGGVFTHINNVPANNLAKWDGTNWSAVGSGLNQINALVTAPNGLVFAGGVDTLGYIHNGAWHPFAFGGSVYTMETDSQSQIYIGGVFGLINNEPMTLVAQWNGTSWTNMNWGFPNFGSGGVNSLEVGNNRVYAVGELLTAVGQPVHHAAVWDGATWDTLGELTGQGFAGAWDINGWPVAINVLATTAEGEIYAGGNFQLAGDETAYSIAKWDGADWLPLGAGIGCHISCMYGNKTGKVMAMDIADSGNLYVAGSFTAAGNIPAHHVAKWNGTTWSPLGDTSFFEVYDAPDSIVVDHNEHVYVPVWVDENTYEVRKWDGTTWSTLGITVGYGTSLSIDNNTVYMTSIQSVENQVRTVAYWTGTQWEQVGPEVPGSVSQILFDKDNTMHLIGGFVAGQDRIYSVMYFDGTNWVPFGTVQQSHLGGATTGLFDEAGMLYVTGYNDQVARWDGVEWSYLGSGLSNPSVLEANSLALDHQGHLFVGGRFTKAGPHHASHIGVWVAGDGACGLGDGGTHTLYAGEHEVTVEVTTAGTLDCVTLQRHQTNHPAATPQQQVGSWWEMVAVDANGEPAAGFTVNLTFPSVFAPVSADGKLCLQTEAGWDCAADVVNGRYVTRQNVTSFGAITIEANMFYQFVPVILR